MNSLKASALALAICLLSGCGSGSDAPAEPAIKASPEWTPPVASEAEIAKVRDKVEKEIRQVSLPDGAPDVPVTLSCSSKECAASQTTFVRRDWPTAWRGDYQGQRNAAFCRFDGCFGGVQVDPVEACAWRVIIMQGNAVKADSTDLSNLRHECGTLDAADRQFASSKARAMFEMIYHRPMTITTIE